MEIKEKIIKKLSLELSPLFIEVEDQSHLHAGHNEAASDVDGLARAEARLLGDEELDGIGDLFRRCEAPHRNRLPAVSHRTVVRLAQRQSGRAVVRARQER